MKNIPLSLINELIPSWLDNKTADSSIVLSSRVRYARNLSGYPFPNRASQSELQQVFEMINQAIHDQKNLRSILSESAPVSIDKLTELQAEFLLERHLISPDFVQKSASRKNLKSTKEVRVRGVFINVGETISVMINEEDHLRMQVIMPGFNFKQGFEQLNQLDNNLESMLCYAYSPRYGYLTACPSNIGTGLRASVLIHLPALVLTREIEKVLRAVWQIHFMVRGLYGEGTETKGYFFQVSNTLSLGQSEDEIIEGIEKITQELIAYEEKSRDYLLTNMKSEIEDKIFRAYALLNSARLLTSEEALNLLATVRLGVATQIIRETSLNTLNKIMILLRPANLQIFYNQKMTPGERDEKRASLIRQILSEQKN
ncbi:MAG: protein arginine kinase [Candidatus Latescibacteria bacterium]|nr:protein arginine kinase [Candidatus Latescibacterota bacterium]